MIFMFFGVVAWIWLYGGSVLDRAWFRLVFFCYQICFGLETNSDWLSGPLAALRTNAILRRTNKNNLKPKNKSEIKPEPTQTTSKTKPMPHQS